MSTRSISIIRAEARERLEARITTQAALHDALPILIELAEAVKVAKRIYDISKDVHDELNDACADYALKHKSVFDKAPETSAKGVTSGDITIGDKVYHLASGYGSPVRTDGEQLSQEFLGALPDGWAKASWHIDTAGINRLGVKAAELEAKGLFRPAKNAWTARESEE